jgi:biotin transport system substrate-specific component
MTTNIFTTRYGYISRNTVVATAAVVAFAVLTFVGANVYIPLTPVPVTLQTLFVLLAGAIAGSRRGAISQALYVGAGSAGLPLFAGFSGGWAVLAGPTGGYLLSFLFIPLLVGAAIARSDTLRWQVFVFSSATAAIFVCGVVHLALFYTRDVFAAVQVGVLPFLPGAVFKIVAATSIYRSYRALSGRRFR